MTLVQRHRRLSKRLRRCPRFPDPTRLGRRLLRFHRTAFPLVRGRRAPLDIGRYAAPSSIRGKSAGMRISLRIVSLELRFRLPLKIKIKITYDASCCRSFYPRFRHLCRDFPLHLSGFSDPQNGTLPVHSFIISEQNWAATSLQAGRKRFLKDPVRNIQDRRQRAHAPRHD